MLKAPNCLRYQAQIKTALELSNKHAECGLSLPHHILPAFNGSPSQQRSCLCQILSSWGWHIADRPFSYPNLHSQSSRAVLAGALDIARDARDDARDAAALASQGLAALKSRCVRCSQAMSSVD